MTADTMIPSSVINLAEAIAFAEGFGADPKNVPTRAHNPGDLKISGYPVTGAEGISIFPDDATGWNHLYSQLIRIKDNNSHVYKTSMTFEQFARHWTDTQSDDWINNVIWQLQEFGYEINKNMTLEHYFSIEWEE